MSSSRRPAMGRWLATVAPALVVGMFAVLIGSWACNRGYSGPVDPIVVAWSPFEHTALFYVAEDQDSFSRNGINVMAKRYDSGANALNGMLKGEADVAVGVAEFPLVAKALQKARIRAIASIDKSDIIYIVARKDRRIRQPSDLKGKRVGTTSGTIAEFYLGRFLTLNGMTMRDVTLVDVRTPADWVNAVVNGDLDAVATAQPYANSAKDGLGANAVIWPAQSKQPMHALIISSSEWITKNPGLAGRFLKSLLQAEEYTARNPAGAKAIVQERLSLDASYMETVWSQNQYEVSLEQSLILAMEDEARWMISNDLTAERTVPNFLDFIHTDSLKSIKPGAVRIAGK